jgi:hypothetical protein
MVNVSAIKSLNLQIFEDSAGNYGIQAQCLVLVYLVILNNCWRKEHNEVVKKWWLGSLLYCIQQYLSNSRITVIHSIIINTVV